MLSSSITSGTGGGGGGGEARRLGGLGDLEADVLQDSARDLADHAAVIDDETGLQGANSTLPPRVRRLG